MNRIWISRQSSISVREQLSTQLIFGIVSRRLRPGERLPSVRELARRLKIHSNTVSAAYRDLAERGWVKRRPGSGVFISEIEHDGQAEGMEELVRAWIAEGVARGFRVEALRGAFAAGAKEAAGHEAREQAGASRLVVVHPDRKLAAILAAEIEEAVGHSVAHAGVEEAAGMELGTMRVLTTTSGVTAVSQLGAARCELIPLKSIEELVEGVARPEGPVLIGMVSRSETVSRWAAMLVPALGLRGSDVIARNPERAGWREGLGACDLIAADVLAAREMGEAVRGVVVVRLIPEFFLREMSGLVTAEKV
jgi:DNA-binding transcriptional regulator YhcF (GntR family)